MHLCFSMKYDSVFLKVSYQEIDSWPTWYNTLPKLSKTHFIILLTLLTAHYILSAATQSKFHMPHKKPIMWL